MASFDDERDLRDVDENASTDDFEVDGDEEELEGSGFSVTRQGMRPEWEEDAVSAADPTTIYLRQIGQIPMLDRSQEEALGREIEAGYEQTRQNLFLVPAAAAYALALARRLESAELTIADVCGDDGADENSGVRNKERAEAFLACAAVVRSLLVRCLAGPSVSVREELATALRALELDIVQLEAMVPAVREEVTRPDTARDGLRPRERRALLEAAEQGLARAREAKARLVEANLRLVVSIAKTRRDQGLNFLDLIQEGSFGLMRAAEKFDYRLGFKFSTYATPWIQQMMDRGIAARGRTIRLPVRKLAAIRAVSRASVRLAQELGRVPTREEVARHAEGVGNARVLSYLEDAVSLDTPLGEDERNSLADLVADAAELRPATVMDAMRLKEGMRRVLSTLTPREEVVLRRRFGVDDNCERTLADVGEEFAVTRERIRQIEAGALRKLRFAPDERAEKSVV